MPRPPKKRHVEFIPDIRYFKPAGVRMLDLEEEQLGVDEFEALRLKDLEGLGQVESAERMNLAQSTFQRLLTGAREKLTRALVEGRAIRIEGGHYHLVSDADCLSCQPGSPGRAYRCQSCQRRPIPTSSSSDGEDLRD